jgi:UDP-4-amino-4,6-dideoxy-N-acetyl-beta-L-altrosamine transaminase
MIPYGKQSINEDDKKSVLEVLDSNWLTTGPKVAEFEEKFAKYVGAKYAVAVSSGTAGLHLACLAGGLEEGDELITSPMTFAASANCALYCGAKPIFVDIDEKTGLIDENLIEKKITDKTKIIIPVHYAGQSCQMEKIKEIADKNNLIIIEDACHALGATFKKEKVGNCSFSDMSVFSFHPVKHITTGEGGMITTNSKKLYEKLLSLRSHGMVREEEKLINKNDGPWYHEMQELGFNYRITDFQCALGISQLFRIDEFAVRRQEIAEKYLEEFSEIEEIECLDLVENNTNAYHLFVIRTKNKETRGKLFEYLKEQEIFCQVHYIPVYQHPYYEKLGYEKGICPQAESFYEKIISIPIYPELKDEEQEKVIKEIKRFYER